jgi:hypothetical protein
MRTNNPPTESITIAQGTLIVHQERTIHATIISLIPSPFINKYSITFNKNPTNDTIAIANIIISNFKLIILKYKDNKVINQIILNLFLLNMLSFYQF